MHNARVDLSAKLQIKPGQQIATVSYSDDVPSVVAASAIRAATPDSADVVVAFVRTRADLAARGVQPVRQIAIDDVWSALRFRPGFTT